MQDGPSQGVGRELPSSYTLNPNDFPPSYDEAMEQKFSPGRVDNILSAHFLPPTSGPGTTYPLNPQDLYRQQHGYPVSFQNYQNNEDVHPYQYPAPTPVPASPPTVTSGESGTSNKFIWNAIGYFMLIVFFIVCFLIGFY